MKRKLVYLLVIGFFSIVFVDPSSALTVTLQPGPEGKDAHIRANDPSDNFGDYSDLTVNWGDSSPDKGLLEFDLSSVAGLNVTGATLSLYHRSNGGNGATFDLFRNTSAWDESTVTWDTAPAYDSLASSSLSIADGSIGVWRDWDVTALVQGWLIGAYDNYGMTLSRIDQPNSYIYFFSSDYIDTSYAPKLTIDYDLGVVVPEPSTYLLLGSGIAGLALWRRRRKSKG